jgi:hypothetical protein
MTVDLRSPSRLGCGTSRPSHPITATPGSIEVFVVAYFLRDLNALYSVREALGVPLRVVRLSVP